MRRMPNDTGKQMIASGQWSKQGKTYVHVSGDRIEKLSDGRWQAGKWVYVVLHAARSAVEHARR